MLEKRRMLGWAAGLALFSGVLSSAKSAGDLVQLRAVWVLAGVTLAL